MKLRIVRRWGSAAPGDSVSVDDEEQARWLIDNSLAVRPSQPETATSGDSATGSQRADIKAGGDWSRRRPSTRRGNREGNLALPVPGSPVRYNAGVDPDLASVQAANGEDAQASSPRPSTKISGSGRRRRPESS